MRTVLGNRRLLSAGSEAATVAGSLPGLTLKPHGHVARKDLLYPWSAPAGALRATLGQLPPVHVGMMTEPSSQGCGCEDGLSY